MVDIFKSSDCGNNQCKRAEYAKEQQTHFLHSNLRGQQTLLQASHLFPDDLELRQLAAVESAFPTIAVEARGEEGSPVAAEVFLRTIDVLTSGVGPAVSIGRAPLAATPVRPGYYRVVVAFEGGGFRELVCNPSYAFTEVKLVATANGEQRSGEGMVRFEACEYTTPDDPGIHWPLEGKTVHLDAFLIDRTEVSNAQYAEFVRATGHPLPSYWKFVEDREQFLAEYGDRPVVGVGWRDAVAFAEWCGKRLPTAAEWLRVAGGIENRPFPYSADPAAPLIGNVHAPATTTSHEESSWQQYMEYSSPVTSHPDACTPEGIYHMFGNVFELTETMLVEELTEGLLVPRQFDRVAFGANWRAEQTGQGMRSVEHWSIGPNNDYFYLGFRCAKSVGP